MRSPTSQTRRAYKPVGHASTYATRAAKGDLNGIWSPLEAGFTETLTLGGCQGRMTLNDDVEADTALAVGLPPYEVSEAELPYLSHDAVPVRPPPRPRSGSKRATGC